jgi:hypothetical protein
MAQRKPPTSRRIANQAARTKRLHRVIGDDARTLLSRYREVDLQDLIKVLARAHSTSPDDVATALTGDSRFHLSGPTVTLRGRGDRAPVAPTRPPKPAAASLADDVLFALTETDTDGLLVTAPDVGVRPLSCDFVRGDRGEEIWIAWAAVGSEEWRAAGQAGAWSDPTGNCPKRRPRMLLKAIRRCSSFASGPPRTPRNAFKP